VVVRAFFQSSSGDVYSQLKLRGKFPQGLTISGSFRLMRKAVSSGIQAEVQNRAYTESYCTLTYSPVNQLLPELSQPFATM
jgi:hypothetical protein